MSQLNDIINQINSLSGFNVPTGSGIIISQSANPVGSGSVNQIVDYINSLTGYNIPSTDVQYVSGANVSGPVIIYTPYAQGGTIPITGIAPGQIITADHVLRIINALNGVNIDDIIISGSLQTSGSNVFNGTLSLPFIEDGQYLFTSGGYVIGTSTSITSASYADTASYAPAYVLNSSTSSMSVLSSSYALTASYAMNGGSGSNIDAGSFATTGSNTFIGNQIISGSVTSTLGFTGSLQGTASWSNNALTASYITASNIVGTVLSASYAATASSINFNIFRITTGSITASVNTTPNNLFLIQSGSSVYLNISSSSNTTLYSDLFVIKNFTTQRSILTVSQSIVQFATQSTIPTGTTEAGSIWFTSSSLFIGLE